MTKGDEKDALSYKMMVKIEMAINSNTSPPSKSELKRIKVKKKIMTSLKREGDSKLGMILFIGVAITRGISRSRIMDYLGLEFKRELDHKISEYNRMLSDKRFINKLKLINNYLNFN